MFTPVPSKILLLYRKSQPLYDRLMEKYPFVEMGEGLDKDLIEAQKSCDGCGTLLILDGESAKVDGDVVVFLIALLFQI